MKKIINVFICMLLFGVVIVSCDGHLPGGIVVEKRHRNAYTSYVYCPTTHMMKPLYHPQKWMLEVKCNECGETHTCYVDESTYAQYAIGDTVIANGYYHGKENR